MEVYASDRAATRTGSSSQIDEEKKYSEDLLQQSECPAPTKAYSKSAEYNA
jgi:hypothetical protein